MQRTNIFIASSSEMHHERLELVDLFTDMRSDAMEYVPVKWEYMDSSVHEEHKQSEYMRRLQKSEICIIMFWRTLGRYTEQELLFALDEQAKGYNLQKAFILFKENGEPVSTELSEFKKMCVQEHGEIVHTFSNSQEMRELVRQLILSAHVKCNESSWEGKEMKVVIAADEELNDEMLEFTELMAHLNGVLENRGIRLRREKWTLQGVDDYREKLRDSEMCLNLYWTKLPQHADEEMRIAYDMSTNGENPLHLYIFFKEPSDEISTALADFKDSFETKYGHFYCTFENVETMNLHFILQFEAKQNILQSSSMKVEDGIIVIDDLRIADMDKLPFAALNTEYKKIKEELETLPEDIEMYRIMTEEHPEQEQYKEQLQKKLDHYNALKDEFTGFQQTLFSTAKRIAEMQLEDIGKDMQRAITAFENGHIEATNAILDGIEQDVEQHLEQLDHYRELVYRGIEALQLKATTLMADLSIPVERRVSFVMKTYQKADTWAERSGLTKEKYILLLERYGEFLYKYAKFDQALNVFLRACQISDDLYGTDHVITAIAYSNIGTIYDSLGNNSIALQYHLKALAIREDVLGNKHPQTAASYNNIASVYGELDKYDEALEYSMKALAIWEEVLGTESSNVAMSYSNLGALYDKTGNYDKALEYCQKALAIRKGLYGENHQETAYSYNGLSAVYDSLRDYDMALEYGQKELEVFERVYGTYHSTTAIAYINVACVYSNQKHFSEALEYYKKALEIQLKVLGTNHSSVANTCICIGIVCNNQGVFSNNQEVFIESARYYIKAFDILETNYEKNSAILNSRNEKYDDSTETVKAPESFLRALDFWEKALKMEPNDIAKAYNIIGCVYCTMDKYVKAYESFRRAFIIARRVFGTEHDDTKTIESNLRQCADHV